MRFNEQYSLASSLQHSCQSLISLKSLHARLLISGSIFSSNVTLNKIIRIYSRLGAIDYAHKVFDTIPDQPNQFIWTALIHGHVENSNYKESLGLFRRMLRESIPPLKFTVSSILKCLSRQKRLSEGESIHGLVVKLSFELDPMVQNSLIDVYARSEEIIVARKVFNGMSHRDVVSWNSMISCYGNCYQVDAALELFHSMPERNVVSWTAMLCGYAKTGNMEEAQNMFDEMPVRDLAAWKVMISGYMDVGNFTAACCTFNKMPSNKDIGSWNIMIAGLCKAGRLDFARDFFDRMPSRNGASWCMMIDGYVKAGDVDNARLLFDQMNDKNLVSWSTMIAGYAKNGQASHALKLFNQFKHLGIEPDESFIMTVISVCSQLGILDIAEDIVSNYVQCTHFSNLHLVTSLIDMYSKCGSVERAWQVFGNVHKKDLFCYSAMIAAFANHGRGREAITLFHEMLSHNIKPDGVAFLGILTACNHGGLVNEGKEWFELMRKEFGVLPLEKHYACLVDLLGRAGCLHDAYRVIKNMPMEPHSVVWGSFLAACRAHRNVELAEVAASWLFEIEPDNSGNYILLSSIYAAAGRWDDVAEVRTLLRKRGVRKNRGSSWIELDHVVLEFVMGDVSHVDCEKIYFVLNLILEDMGI